MKALFLVIVFSIPSVIYSQSEQTRYFAHFFFKERPGISKLSSMKCTAPTKPVK